MRGQQIQKTTLSRASKNTSCRRNEKMQATGGASGNTPIDSVKTGKIPVPHCSGCRVSITDDVRALQCDRCASEEAWKCIDCLNLKPDIYDAILEGATELKWFCNQCEKVVGEESSNDTTKLEELTKLLEKFLERTNVIEQKLSEKADTGTVSKLEQSMACLEERLNKQIEDRIKVVEVLCQNLVGAPSKREVEDSIVLAVKDKMEEDKGEEAEIARRKTNMIVFGLSESHSDDTEERKMEDSCQISEMLHVMDVSGVDVRQVVRLGPRQTDQDAQPRLVKVVLGNEEQHQTVLKSAKNLRNAVRGGWNRVFVQPDLTPKQRTARRQLVTELKERQLRGELNLMIVNDKIVTRRYVPIGTGGVDQKMQQQVVVLPSVADS